MTNPLELDQDADATTIEIPTTLLEVDSSTKMPIIPASSELATFNLPDWLEQNAKIVTELPSYLGQVYQNNKNIVTALGLFFGAILALKLAFAVLSAVNEIPLLSPTFELVGISYMIWFVSRYLLHAATRDELAGEISGLKSQVLGDIDRS